ncbi:MAG: DUF3987 domain-containing protein, partial [Deltaproteobacteria bacterium]|nr:DUF3987 domain-containing protein [Deltaproteobacteria bacterium]
NDLAVEEGPGAVKQQVEQAQPIPSAFAQNEETLKRLSASFLRTQDHFTDIDLTAFPSILHQYIDQLSWMTSANIKMIIQSVFCMLSGVIAKKIVIPRPHYYQDLFPDLWWLSVSPSGQFKTTSLKSGAEIAYQIDRDISELILAERRRKIELENSIGTLSGKEKASQAQEIKAIDDRITHLIRTSPILSNRATSEALIDILQTDIDGLEHNGGLIVISELAEFLQHFEKSYNAGTKPLLADWYDVPEVWKNITKSGGISIVNRPYLTLNAASSVKWAQDNLKPSDVSTGFGSRWLLFYVPKAEAIPPGLPTPKSIDRSAEFAVKDILLRIREGAQRSYTLSDEAKKAFLKFHESLYKESRAHGDDMEELISPFVRRWSPTLLKIAMLTQPFFDFETNIIGVEAIAAGIEVINAAVESTIYLLANDLGESPHQAKERKVMTVLAKNNGNLKRAKLMTLCKLGGGTKQVEYVLEALAEKGRIKIDATPKNRGDWVYYMAE